MANPTGKLELTVTARAGAAHVPFLRRRARAAHAMMRSPLRQLSIALVGDRTMARLHQRHMNQPGTTDVISFPLDLRPDGRATVGEIVLCVPQAARQARRRNTPLAHELLLYAIHGMLHLDGWDDRTPRECQQMHAREDRILSRLGIGPVFDRPAATRR